MSRAKAPPTTRHRRMRTKPFVPSLRRTPSKRTGAFSFAPRDRLAGAVVAVAQDAFDQGETPPGPLKDALRPIAVLNVAPDLDREQPAIGVRQYAPLAAL